MRHNPSHHWDHWEEQKEGNPKGLFASRGYL